MRYGWWVNGINGIIGVILIVAPYFGHFQGDQTALYTDVVAGILLLAWAIVSYAYGQRSEDARHSHA